jgi:hypothetical protein
MVILYTTELSYLPMTTIAILAILTILGVAALSVTGFSVVSPVAAQTPTGDNISMTGNMTGGKGGEVKFSHKDNPTQIPIKPPSNQ